MTRNGKVCYNLFMNGIPIVLAGGAKALLLDQTPDAYAWYSVWIIGEQKRDRAKNFAYDGYSVIKKDGSTENFPNRVPVEVQEPDATQVGNDDMR